MLHLPGIGPLLAGVPAVSHDGVQVARYGTGLSSGVRDIFPLIKSPLPLTPQCYLTTISATNTPFGTTSLNSLPVYMPR